MKDTALLWQIEASAPLAEEAGYLIADLAPLGVELLDDRRFRFWIRAASADTSMLSERLAEDGISLISVTQSAEKNWLQECQDVWQELTVGALSVVPVLDERSPPSTSRSRLQLVPGTGFGTGHHATTKTALELLQAPCVAEALRCDEPRALDLGTGSGILALAISALYDVPTDAIDNDPLALENAATNVALNPLLRGVELRCGTLEAANRRYNLIVANIYAEVLCDLSSSLCERAAGGGILVLSGIMERKGAMVKDRFRTHGWETANERLVDGWHAFILSQAR